MRFSLHELFMTFSLVGEMLHLGIEKCDFLELILHKDERAVESYILHLPTLRSNLKLKH